jgi:2,3-dihydroxybenzoate decarboxylase
MKKIALEEHFMTPGLEEYWSESMEDVNREAYSRILAKLTEFGEVRLGAMDGAGISRTVLSVAGPGVQREQDTAIALRKASETNDWIAREIEKHPTRYAAFAHLALQDPRAAADELERCVRQLGFCGAMINGHTNGQYLDDIRFDPVWERAQHLGVPIYLHPADPMATFPAMAGFNSLRRAMWEWGMETGTHALRIILGGVFDRHPQSTLILGHLGEMLPYLLWRFDSRAKLYGLKLKKAPSEYIREHIFVTTSGMFSFEPLQCAVSALGAERVMFSVDYPFESSEEGARFIEGVPFDTATREAICFDNAARVLGLNGNSGRG